MIQGKIWGHTECLFKHNGVECHKIFIKKGTACSIHSHMIRSNAFYVISGALVVETHKNDYDLIDMTLIMDGMKCTAPAGEKHRFIALEDTVALEWYWVDDIRRDIERESHGCVLKDKELKEVRDAVRYKDHES